MSNPNPDMSGLILFKKGQSGNPQGSSRRQRAQRSLRAALREKVSASIPPEILAELVVAFPEGASAETLADFLAQRVIYRAAVGNGKELMEGVSFLAALEGPQRDAPDEERSAPDIPDDIERKRKVAAALQEAKQLVESEE